MTGPAGILGCPGSGKTTLARALASADVAASGCPLIIVDTGRNELFEDQYHAAGLAEVLDIVWGEGDHVTWTPARREEFDALCGAIYEAAEDARRRGAPAVLPILLLDEIANILPPSKQLGANCQKCLREQRRTLSGFYATGQLYHDGGRVLKGLVTDWYVHRMTAPEDQSDLRADYGLDPDVVGKLPSAKECAQAGRPTSEAYIHLKVGF